MNITKAHLNLFLSQLLKLPTLFGTFVLLRSTASNPTSVNTENPFTETIERFNMTLTELLYFVVNTTDFEALASSEEFALVQELDLDHPVVNATLSAKDASKFWHNCYDAMLFQV